jgi:hypothetical protein
VPDLRQLSHSGEVPARAPRPAHRAAARHQRAVERAERALRELDAAAAAITFQSVARRAGVSRQWLYTQPALRSQIERSRDHAPARHDGVPVRQRPTEASLRQRLEALRSENQRLREENANLNTELAIAYGQQRRVGDGSPRHTRQLTARASISRPPREPRVIAHACYIDFRCYRLSISSLFDKE